MSFEIRKSLQRCFSSVIRGADRKYYRKHNSNTHEHIRKLRGESVMKTDISADDGKRCNNQRLVVDDQEKTFENTLHQVDRFGAAKVEKN